MLGQVTTCHDDQTQGILSTSEKKHGALFQHRAVNFWRGLSSNMFSHMICDALYETDSGEGTISLVDIAGAPPYHVTSLLSHKHSRYEVISGVTLPLIEWMMACHETTTSSAFRERIVELGAPEVSSLQHQQQKNPPFVLKYNLYGY